MTEIDPAELVRKVAIAYEELLKVKEGNDFIAVSMPKPGSKSFTNCLEVHEWCLERGFKLKSYFEAVFSTYDSAWCQKNFKRPYPPFGVASSIKVLARIDSEISKDAPIKNDPDRVVKEIADTIRKHPEQNWHFILDNVYGYLPYEIRASIRANLEGGFDGTCGEN